MLETYHFQNTEDKLSITPYSKNLKSTFLFGGLGIFCSILPFFIDRNVYFSYFLFFLSIVLIFQAVYNYLNIDTIVTFNKKDRCIYETFMGKEKKVMTFDQADIVRWIVNNRMEFFALSKDKYRSKRYKISHDYNIKKDYQENALYQEKILNAIESCIKKNN